jgi:N-acetyl-beta-hexosaminidase
MYALESFTQLLDEQSGQIMHSSVAIDDAPEYAWRGLMIDR